MIISLSQASKIIKTNNRKNLYISGFFDFVHLGHIEFFKKCREYGDCLFVAIESDYTANNLLPKPGVVNFQENRAQFLNELKAVDYVIVLSDSLSNPTSKAPFVERLKKVNSSTWLVPSWDPYIKYKQQEALEAGIKLQIVDIEYLSYL